MGAALTHKWDPSQVHHHHEECRMFCGDSSDRHQLHNHLDDKVQPKQEKIFKNESTDSVLDSVRGFATSFLSSIRSTKN